ncbi:hypothetical protein ACWGPT_06690 [Pseudorhizobium sp. NPDC055634]
MESGEWLVSTISSNATAVFSLLKVLGTEFWSAIAGAIVGGVIAFAMQRSSMNAARRFRDEDRLRDDQALAYSLLFKAMAIDGNLSSFRSHVVEAEQLSSQRKAPISAVMFALANPPTAVEFAPPEMAMLLKLKDDDLFNDVMNLDRIHNSVLPVWTLYAGERNSMSVLMEGAKFNSEEGSTEFAFEKDGDLARKIYEVDQIAQQLVHRAKVDAEQSSQIVPRLAKHLNERLGLGIGLTKP